jgi:hypothetical protein
VSTVAGSIQLLILIIFAMLILLLAQSRELMRQIARTAEEWHRMRDAMRGPRPKHKPLMGSPDLVGADDLGPGRPEDTQPDGQ